MNNRLKLAVACSWVLLAQASAVAAVVALAPVPAHAQSSRIVAVVNGDVISEGDVENRAKLFALSAGVANTPDMLARLRPQVTRQLIDERLRLQEIQRRHVNVTDKEIAAAIHEVETRNNMPADALRHKLESDGVSFRTLVDQVRVQLGWLRVIRDQLGDAATITPTEVAEQRRILASQTGKPQYRVSEIFIPADTPAHASDSEKFAETVIKQLRSGAPFAVVAAQFSQSQTALEGGDLGWVEPNELDPEIAHIVAQMPVGAISNPVRVPGGYDIVTLRAKREIGHDIGTMLTMRQLFLPFTSPLDPQHPTEQQRSTLERAKALSAGTHGCDAMEAAAKAVGSTRPVDPGPVRLETINPAAFRVLLSNLPDGKASQPLVSGDGIAVMMVCSRAEKNLAQESTEDIQRRLLAERAELVSRQLLRDLQRKAEIERRDGAAAPKT